MKDFPERSLKRIEMAQNRKIYINDSKTRIRQRKRSSGQKNAFN